jgi:hypothetical protein
MSIEMLPFPLVSIPVAVRGPPEGVRQFGINAAQRARNILRRTLLAASPLPITLPQAQYRELRHEAVEFRR